MVRNDIQHSPRQSNDSSGFALVLVIGIVGVLAVFAAAFSISIRSQTRTVSSIVGMAQAEALADGGVELGAMALLEAVASGKAPETVAPVRVALTCRIADGAMLIVAAEDEAGKIDLNAANELLLAQLLMLFGASDAEAFSLVDAIVDFRDADDLVRVNGAEATEYRDAGLARGPKNALFQTVEELEQVLGLRPQLYVAIKPYLTVHSRRPGIDPAVAPLPVLAAATGLDLASIKALAGNNSAGRSALQIPFNFVSPSNRRAYLVRSTAVTERQSVFRREAIIELVGRLDLPFVTRTWERGFSSDPEPLRSNTSHSANAC